jgi:hypothetical protein
MGFMDKAKKMADQAQQKIDEKQKQWNQREAQDDAPGAGAVVFDDHGRPVPNETSEAQAEAGIPVGESQQAEPGTDPPGASQGEGASESAHAPLEGERPEGVDAPGEGQPPARRVEKSGAAGNAEGNQTSSSGADTSPDPFKRPE